MEIVKSYKSLKESDVNELERVLSFALPKDYLDFMYRNNGGEPIPCDFCFNGEGEEVSETSIQYFFPIGSVFQTNVKDKYLFLSDNERIPKGLIPIAIDNFGNLICLSLLVEGYGKVYFWDHELEGEESNLFFVAESFDEFLDMLTELE